MDNIIRPIPFKGYVGWRDGKPHLIIREEFSPQELGAIHAAMWEYLKSINYNQHFDNEQE